MSYSSSRKYKDRTKSRSRSRSHSPERRKSERTNNFNLPSKSYSITLKKYQYSVHPDDVKQSERDQLRHDSQQKFTKRTYEVPFKPSSEPSKSDYPSGNKKKPFFGIHMKLVPKSTKTQVTPSSVAKAFASDDESEEMPVECKMRMRNIGRETPTSSGPNSYGKTKEGFVNTSKLFEKKLKNLHADD